ncbi:hypothetical protein GCM10023063_48670 [Arthrobacter methylotrophus]|uniref:hypothetical protein n=1 Tax=Arthrobacter methylotrophus TaxID=121291 RepID=UPI0031E5F691
MKSVRLFAYVQFDGDTWQIAARDGAELALRNLATGRIRRIQVSDLLAHDSFVPEATGPI